jgi:hypothetical protein
MCQPWCLRGGHCTRDQSTSCLCCFQSLTMYKSRRQQRGLQVIHSHSPDSTVPLHASNDSIHQRMVFSFTPDNSHQAPRPIIPKSSSHTLPHHGGGLCSSLANNVQGYRKDDANRATTMDNTHHELLDLFPPDQYVDSVQSMWPPVTLSSQFYQEPTQAQAGFNTVSPGDLTVQSRPPHPVPAPATPQGHVVADASNAASNKSSSHISTPALTPQTPNGSCSTPETSIEGGDGDQFAVLQSRPATTRPHKHKKILPAPPKCYSGDIVASLPPDFPECPPSTFYPRPDEASLPGTLQNGLLPFNTLVADDLIGVGQADPDPVLTDPPWPGPNPNYDQNAFADISALFNFDDDEDFAGNSTTDTTYPPIPDHTVTNFKLPASNITVFDSHFTTDPFLPSYPAETEFPFLGNADSRPYTGTMGTGAIPVVDFTPQSVELGVSSTQYGEGSRRDTSRDLELLDLRSQGMSYREIKQKYEFTEAESTLRGRYRTLTKSKDKRVRKPIWKDKDVSRWC